MKTTRSPQYTRVAITLHWLIALLIAANFVLAWSAEDLPKEQAAALMGYHMANGLTVLGLTLFRIVWRLIYKGPALSAALSAWEVALARVTHFMFYFLLLFIPLTGWAMVSGGGRPVGWFGLFQAPALPVGSDKALGGIFKESHEVLAIVMLALFALHVLGALKHMFLDHDDTMARMIPMLRRR
ncbi:cytochrome b [Novosphingobium malaysiense]|uniref:Cytochrome b561 bacterial/Ni-hydrogenase domain-containing protein n=1 Tax=Novosphingobium malaysiense TaxID=1348853 RepID=A0A0B1ZR23_9SPHN|nr:cytochrome b [Novosphingobium malaysiense]KHK91627.1 hypothetical protein LK12_12580 [Novosphingobium malaysiense]